MRLVRAALALTLATSAGGPVIAAQGAPPDGVRLLLGRLERAAESRDPGAYFSLLSDFADRDSARAFQSAEIAPGLTRIVIQEREREPLPGTLPGNGYSLTVDAFEEYGTRARIATWQLDVKRVGERDDEDAEWLIADQSSLSSVENLNRLTLDPTRQFAVRGLKISREDLDVSMTEGTAFVSIVEQGPTAIVLLGRGEMRFHPTPAVEQTQVRIFSGSEAVESAFDAAYFRINPADFDTLIPSGALVAAPLDAAAFRRADRIFREDSQKAYGLELGDLSRDAWSFLPPPGDIVAEIHTRRFNTLTYSRVFSNREDLSLVDRARRKTISLYPSREKQETTGGTAGDRREYDVISYDVDVTLSPDRKWIEGQVRMALTVRAPFINAVTIRLATPLVVKSVVSREYGRLFSMRMRNQDSVLVNLRAPVPRDTRMTLTIEYAGQIEPQRATSDALSMQQPDPGQSDWTFLKPEPSFLYSTDAAWYPSSPETDFATAALRITVPADYECVASGTPDPDSPMPAPPGDSGQARVTYAFSAKQPVRYLAFLVGRLDPAGNVTIGFSPSTLPLLERPDGMSYRDLALSVHTSPRDVARGREVATRAADMALFYQSLLDDSPYPSFAIALVENELPGGHSPAYFAALNEPVAASRFDWRSDPAAFSSFPDFFIAHELAHQWWGQAVGWQTYHDQWLSEGLSQDFASLYARRQKGDDAFGAVMRQMRRWAIAQSDQGPISLGYRLGHVRNDTRVFRAIAYDKAAVVMHMLREFIGDEAFSRGLRRFYRNARFQNVNTADFRNAMEAEAGRPLGRFFERWIEGSELPRIRFAYSLDGDHAVLHVEQAGTVFDFPLAVTLQYTDGTTGHVVVPITEAASDTRIPLGGTLRRAEIDRNDGMIGIVLKN